MRLVGKVALVTGAQQGIGKAIALAFGREGANVVVNYLDDQAASEAIVKKIHEAGGRAVAVAGSVARMGDVRTMVEAGTVFGGIDILVNNAGIFGFTRATALELARYRIRVNAIAPGTTDTAQPRYGMSEEELQAVGRQVPLGRMAVPDDIASMAVFLASEEASHITGQTMHVNGGAYLY